jgi:cell wall-associated NlpC family hydrolase
MSVAPTELQPGDLVFFNTTGASPSHVGISIGGEQFVHAPSSTGEVRVERLGTSYWAGRLVGVRRVD